MLTKKPDAFAELSEPANKPRRRGRPKGTRKLTPEWFACLQFEYIVLFRRIQELTLEAGAEILKREGVVGRHVTPKRLRRILAHPPFLDIPIGEVPQFIVRSLTLLLHLLTTARHLTKAPPLNLQQVADLMNYYLREWFEMLATKHALSGGSIKSLRAKILDEMVNEEMGHALRRLGIQFARRQNGERREGARPKEAGFGIFGKNSWVTFNH